MAFDQFDNACRVASLGCGVWLRRDRDLIRALSDCLEGKFQSACETVAARRQIEPAAKIAAEEIGRLSELAH
jgi:UDP:flavonoid glycosyltransferase YjiC (YdhE family)